MDAIRFFINKRNPMDLEQLTQTLYKFLVGIVAAIFGYFSPIKNFVHLLIFLLIIDTLFGYWANYKLKNEKFLFSKVWKVTLPRMLVGVTLIVCAYLWDIIYQQIMFETYRIVGWILSGFVLVSIAQNGYKITNWGPVKEVGNLVLDKLPVISNRRRGKDG